jgi:hypothetical protein
MRRVAAARSVSGWRRCGLEVPGRGSRAGALVCALLAIACDRSEPASARNGARGSTEHPRTTSSAGDSVPLCSAARSSSSTTPPMTSAGSAQAHNPIAEAFSGEPPQDGEPAAIYRAARPSGVIVLIPGDFRGRLAPLGEGLVTNKATSQGVATSSLSFRVEPRKPSTTELGPAALTLACNANVLTNPSWEPGVDVVWGAQQGRTRVERNRQVRRGRRAAARLRALDCGGRPRGDGLWCVERDQP